MNIMDTIRHEPGWTGGFSRNEVPGAWKNGTRVVKTASESGDSHPDGTPGTILGSIAYAAVRNGAICYFVEWDSAPKVAVACMAFKVRPAP